MSMIDRNVSEDDSSRNWIIGEKDKLECRYVRRVRRYFALYLSSQTGCDFKCRMCHLTATEQFNARDASLVELFLQAHMVLSYYRNEAVPADLVHFNFMAQGEPLSSKVILEQNDELFSELDNIASENFLDSKILISTIMPKHVKGRTLRKVFDSYLPEIYYSLYSMDAAFREKWLPNAMDPESALAMLSEWQDDTNKKPKIHFAFIKGENDSEADLEEMCEAVDEARLSADFNIVRYNPYSDKYGEESSEDVIERNIRLLKEAFPDSTVQVVQRVGFDVNASCGMFYDRES